MKATPVSPGTASSPQPVAQAPNQANAPMVTEDARGRKIGYRKPSALDRYRVSKMLGAEVATNQEAAGLAMLAYLCTSIDGDEVVTPNTERQIEALIVRLDNEGTNAIGLALAVDMGMLDDDAKAALKNS